jgi:hypothetical protein
MSPHFSENSACIRETWLKAARWSIDYLLDLSQVGETVLRSLPIDLTQCESVPAMISIVFRLYSIQSSLYKNVNRFLRFFPIQLVGKFMKELRGLLSYIYLLQSSVDYSSRLTGNNKNRIVYRGFPSNGAATVALYQSLIGEVIIWPAFVSTSTDIACVFRCFVRSENGILFEIELHEGDAAADIAHDSDYSREREVLIAASTGFLVVGVGEKTFIRRKRDVVAEFTVRVVKLKYFMHWYDLDIETLPPVLLV